MTYSVNARARTRDECKQIITQKLNAQIATAAVPAQQIDRPHIERLLHGFVDEMPETPFEDIVVEAYGYVSLAGNGTPRLAVANVKVYCMAHHGEEVVPPPGMTMPPTGTY